MQLLGIPVNSQGDFHFLAVVYISCVPYTSMYNGDAMKKLQKVILHKCSTD